jgi:Flp pilus assembly protein TadG
MSRSIARSERGAVIIQVAIALLALTAFSALVLDYGVLWTSRGQAQNAADAGALAAAITLKFNPSDTAGAVAAAKKLANANAVWTVNTADANILVQTGLTCPPGSGGGPGCVRVDVLRGSTDRNGGTHTNTLPTFFANLVGINSQAINATAMAQVSSGDSLSCIKPWIVADKWIEGDETPIGSWDQNSNYNPPIDTYVKPGFNYIADRGLELPLKPGVIGTWSAGWAMEIEWPGHTGSSEYRDNIESCPSWVPTVSLYDDPTYPCSARGDTPDPSKGCISVKTGMSQGPTSLGVNYLVNQDSSASWSATGGTDGLGGVTGGCMFNDPPNCTNSESPDISPRVVPIAVFNTEAYYNESGSCSGTTCVAQVVEFLGFFIEGMCSDVYSPGSRPTYCGTNADAQKTVLGRIMKYPGQALNNGGTTTSTFATAVRLVR